MNKALPELIIISGPPGAGKSTLARPLATLLNLPLFAKDQIKEQFADAIGESALPFSRQIGLAAHQRMISTALELLRASNGVIIESFFHKGLAEPDIAPLLLYCRAVLVHIRADEPILISRYERRETDPERHPVHRDGNRLGQLRQYLAEGVADPLELEVPQIVIDTTYGPIDVEEVAMMVRDALLRGDE